MSADLLREAAALMRKRAKAATPGLWRHVDHGGIEAGDYDEVIVPGPVSCMSYCYGGRSTIDGDRIDLDGEHIASWHPAVALAAADWLEESAEHLEAHADSDSYPDGLREHVCPTALEGPDCSVLGQSLTVARAYLRSES